MKSKLYSVAVIVEPAGNEGKREIYFFFEDFYKMCGFIQICLENDHEISVEKVR